MKLVIFKILRVICVPLAFVCVVLNSAYTRHNEYSELLIKIIIYFVYLSELIIIQRKIMRTEQAPLLDECNPPKFIEKQFAKLNERRLKRMSIFTKITLIQIANGYMFAGEFEKCKQTLDKVNFKRVVFYQAQAFFLYHYVLCLYYLQTGEIEQAVGLLKTMRKRHFRKSNCEKIHFLEAQINLLMENISEAEKFFKKSVKTADSLCKKVRAYYYLAVIYEKKKDERAKKLLEYVIENGNRLHYVKQAKNMLENMC